MFVLSMTPQMFFSLCLSVMFVCLNSQQVSLAPTDLLQQRPNRQYLEYLVYLGEVDFLLVVESIDVHLLAVH